MIELKPGNGGYGLEAYDTATGKYADSVSISFTDENGEKHSLKNFKDFLKLIGGQDFVDTYENDDEFKKMIHDYQGEDGLWQFYENLLKQEVDRLNKEEERRKENVEFFKTSTDVANNAHKFFTKETIDSIINHPGYKRNKMIYEKNGDYNQKWIYGANLYAELFREARYGKERMKPISEAEWNQKCGKYVTTEKMQNTGGERQRYYALKARIEQCKKDGLALPIYRGTGVSDTLGDKIAITSFFKKDFADSESVAFTGHGYYDSVIYMSAIEQYAKGYSRSIDKLIVQACVELNDDLKVLYINDTSYLKEFNNFRANGDYKIFINNLKKSMSDMGYDQNTIDEFSHKISDQCQFNVGFSAMLFGYDALCGDAGQFDILNMRKVYAVDKGWFK